MSATLYITKQSPVSETLRRRLQADRDDVAVIDVSERPELIPELLKLTGGVRIVPVLVDGDGVHVAPDGGDSF